MTRREIVFGVVASLILGVASIAFVRLAVVGDDLPRFLRCLFGGAGVMSFMGGALTSVLLAHVLREKKDGP